MKEANSCFLELQTKHPSGLNNFKHSIWMDMTKQPTKFNFFLTSASWENEKIEISHADNNTDTKVLVGCLI